MGSDITYRDILRAMANGHYQANCAGLCVNLEPAESGPSWLRVPDDYVQRMASAALAWDCDCDKTGNESQRGGMKHEHR